MTRTDTDLFKNNRALPSTEWQEERREKFRQEISGVFVKIASAKRKIHAAETALPKETARYRQLQDQQQDMDIDCEAELLTVRSAVAKANLCAYQGRYELLIAGIDLEKILEQLQGCGDLQENSFNIRKEVCVR